MEKAYLLIFSLMLLTISLPKTQGFCSKVSHDWHSCNGIQNADIIESTIHYFLESDASIKKLSIENCNMSTISTTLFAHEYFSRITDLNITSSLVEFIEIGSFKNLRLLQNLNISENKITEFDGKFLENLSYFSKISLKRNQIKTLRNMCSANYVKEIFIEDSEFASTTINENTFRNCNYLERLSLINTGINDLKTNISLHFPNLRVLNLTGNNFDTFDSFNSNASLFIKTLDISNNKLKILDAEIFRKTFKNLNAINLNSNLIDYLVFSGQEPLENTLREIYLNGNQLKTVNNVFFKYFSELQTLDIDNNPLENIASLSFKNLNILRKLYIKNSLKKISTLNEGIFNGLFSLEELDLSSASISSIENFVFKDLISLEKLNLENNSLTELSNGTFAGLKQLKQLNLDNNKISSIEAGAFFGLSNIDNITPKTFFSKIHHLKARHFEGLSYYYVSELDLSYLGIRTLEAQTFKGLFGLRNLHLQGNDITELVANVFKGIEYLENLNVSSNHLSVIHTGAFSGLTELKKLDLSDCQLVKLHPDTFEGVFGLFTINLSNNKLRSVEPWVFRKLHSLQTLYLHDNVITDLLAHSFTGLSSIQNLTLYSKYVTAKNIEAGAFNGIHSISSNLPDVFRLVTILKTDIFNGIPNLRVIDFSKYRIETIESYAFRGVNYIDILNLESNAISVLHKNAFSSPVTIELLNLKHNLLNGLSADPFLDSNITKLILDDNNFNVLNFTVISQIPYLKVLNINNASIERLISSSEDVKHLRELYLRNNLISFLNQSTFIGMRNLVKLDLSGNPITKIEFTAFKQLTNLEYLFLSNMMIGEIALSTLDGLTSLTHLSIHNSSMEYLRGYAFINTNLRQLNLTKTYIENLSPLAFDSIKNLTDLTLSNCNLTNINGILDHYSLVTLRKLNLSYNNIDYIDCGELNYLNQLEILHLDNNDISDINYCAFRNLTNLKALNLFSNKLNSFRTGIFSDLKHLKTLNVSYNMISSLNNYDLISLNSIDYLDFSFNQLESIPFESLHPNFRLYVGLAENKFRCVTLFNILENFKTNSISLLDYGLIFNTSNIDGIKCV